MAKFLLINPNSNCILVINQLKLSLIIASRLLVLKNSLHFLLPIQRNSPQIKDWLQ